MNRHSIRCAVGLVAALVTVGAVAVPVVTSAAGASAAGVQAAVDAFRADLGTLNPNTAGSAAGGRREINWDGVPDAFSAPNALPGNFFNVNSLRGVVLSTPGSSLQTSATAASGTAVEFGNLNPAFTAQFATFSPQRLFTAIGSNVVDVDFFVPGSTTAASTSGFGVVFTDVDVANVTSLSFFDVGGGSLGTFAASAASGNETLSFLGVRFNAGERVGRVRITSGQGLAAGADAGDAVVMDDFIYAEPLAVTAAIPEPSTVLLLAGGLGLMGWRARRRAGERH